MITSQYFCNALVVGVTSTDCGSGECERECCVVPGSLVINYNNISV